jgi:hypothetical protein
VAARGGDQQHAGLRCQGAQLAQHLGALAIHPVDVVDGDGLRPDRGGLGHQLGHGAGGQVEPLRRFKRSPGGIVGRAVLDHRQRGTLKRGQRRAGPVAKVRMAPGQMVGDDGVGAGLPARVACDGGGVPLARRQGVEKDLDHARLAQAGIAQQQRGTGNAGGRALCRRLEAGDLRIAPGERREAGGGAGLPRRDVARPHHAVQGDGPLEALQRRWRTRRELEHALAQGAAGIGYQHLAGLGGGLHPAGHVGGRAGGVVHRRVVPGGGAGDDVVGMNAAPHPDTRIGGARDGRDEVEPGPAGHRGVAGIG